MKRLRWSSVRASRPPGEIERIEVRDELNANAARREELKAKLAAADDPPPLLHPGMADLYRQKITALAQALEHPETRTEASEALRGLIDAIVLTPNLGELQIELKGNLGGDAGCRPKCEEVARNGRPLAASCDGCGGLQPPLSAALAPGRLICMAEASASPPWCVRWL